MSLLEYGIDGHIIAIIVDWCPHVIESYYLTPKIVGESVGLSPMVVMISLIVGSSFMGIWDVVSHTGYRCYLCLRV